MPAPTATEVLNAAVLRIRAHARLPAEAGQWVRTTLGSWELAWRVLPDGREAFGMRGKRAPGTMAVANVVRALPYALIPERVDRDDLGVAVVFYQRDGMQRCMGCEKEPASTNKGSFNGFCAYCTAIRRAQCAKLPGTPTTHGWFAPRLTDEELAETEKHFPSRGQG